MATLTSSEPDQPTLCSTCHTQPSKYTCPGCSTRTCSLACSRSHKSSTNCTGERNKAKYVPMNEYGWGTMMNDYTFLEEVGRRVAEAGDGIVRGGFGSATDRTKGRGPWKSVGGGGKREIYKNQMGVRDVEVDLLPAGMERRKVNQSMWDFKKQTAFLTIELKFHPPPPDPLLPPPEEEALKPYRILTQRANASHTLLSLLQSLPLSSSSKSKKTPTPEWVNHLIPLPTADPETYNPPHCVMQAGPDPRFLQSSRKRSRKSRPKMAYWKLDPTQSLLSQLRHKHFTEFPTVEICEEFGGLVLGSDGSVVQDDEEEVWEEEDVPQKRRKLDVKEGQRAIKSLLGGYGSDSDSAQDDDEGEEEVDKPNGMKDLGATYDISSSEDEGEEEVDPATLLRLLQEASRKDLVEDEVDWAISEDEGSE